MHLHLAVHEELENKMKKTASVLKEEFNTVRAGRANPALLDKIVVEYYGAPTPLRQLSNISVPEPRMLVVQPFDSKIIPNIEKAINAANVGINPSNDGKMIRLSFPQVTEERRRELTKTVKKMGEDAKIAIRNERRGANDALKKLEKDGEMTEDDLKSSLEEVQEMIDQYIRFIDKMVDEKDKEIMEV